jgi:cyanophycinase-like exopeptidase
MRTNGNQFKLFFQLMMAVIMLVVMLGQASSAAAGNNKVSYEYYVVGNGGNVNTNTSAGLVLMGGGTDVDAAFQWMIGKMGGGDFVVIRATGTDAYNPYIYGLGTVDSVETIIIKNRAAASDPFVVRALEPDVAVVTNKRLRNRMVALCVF